MLKTIGLLNSAPKAFKADDNKIFGDSDNKTNETVMDLSNQSKNNKSRNWTHVPNTGAIKKYIFQSPMLKKFLIIYS